MGSGSSARLIAVAAAALLVGCGGDGDHERPRPRQAPLPLGGVEQRITTEGLNEHLTALQRIAAEHGGHRSVGTAGERATADYLAGRLRAAGYRVRVQDVAASSFRERTAPRVTVGSRRIEVTTLRFSGSGNVSGRVRAVGLGCSRAAFAGLRRDEVALVRRGTCSFRSKALAAQRAGARAVLISDRTPVRGSLQDTGVRVPVVAVGGRGAGLAGARVRVRVDASSAERRSANVIAEAGSGRVVMAGAHLDSVPEGPGLNDNGSGVAAVLEIAEELGGRALPEGVALRFGFWGAEEIGLVGSTQYVEGLSREQRRAISAYVNLDMVGSPGARPAIYDGDATIAAALRRQLGPDAPSDDLGSRSDHAPFDRAGIPVGGLFTGLDRCYHRECDTIENVDREVLTASARAAGAALAELALDRP
ncbi:M20/M25/M40 family metallo-hydrolase [Solirubrobacter sp. CPCC 204708]|uniref:M20/M25/M40 family metallo-hydrolase n=1 Tax=Solirubrobacter deserti TaxID=2282478 RepID=A0ABT4RQT6_9ACTN|nr:M20/M25/M40 family metallo-hydrolase [Solirubrobacter deserti]MBE2319384.1 M20/M25/M40 family metallo-hydrolase [Solirubrobacter deserti]MDA0140881.1 M20/M25/M40 family metallo-hydrolase [Solirubrobacter deserti]